MKWLGEHVEELERLHPGCWIAIQGSQLIAVGKDLDEVMETARLKGIDNPLVSGVRAKQYQEVRLFRR